MEMLEYRCLVGSLGTTCVTAVRTWHSIFL